MSGGKKRAQRRDVLEVACKVEDLATLVTNLCDGARATKVMLDGRLAGIAEVQARIGAALGTLTAAVGRQEHAREQAEQDAKDDLPAVRRRLEDALACIRDVAMNANPNDVADALTLIAEHASFAVYGASEGMTRQEFADSGTRAADRWRDGVGSEAEVAWRVRRPGVPSRVAVDRVPAAVLPAEASTGESAELPF